MRQPLRIAIVGCGRMGKIRANACIKLGAEVVIAVDPDQARAEELAHGSPQARTATDPNRLDWGDIDAVFLCDPPSARTPVIMSAIQHAVPFFAEKPISTNAADAIEIERSLAKSPVITAVGYMNRYRSSIVSAREAVAAGQAIGFNAQWINSTYQVPWWKQAEFSGGPINEQATHFVDLARYLMGEVRSVFCLEQRDVVQPDSIISASIALEFYNGTVGTLLYSCGASYKSIRLNVQMKDKEFSWNGWDLVPEGASNPYEQDKNLIFLRETEAFLSAASTGESGIKSDYPDALKTQLVVDAIIKSSMSRKVEIVSSLL